MKANLVLALALALLALMPTVGSNPPAVTPCAPLEYVSVPGPCKLQYFVESGGTLWLAWDGGVWPPKCLHCPVQASGWLEISGACKVLHVQSYEMCYR